MVRVKKASSWNWPAYFDQKNLIDKCFYYLNRKKYHIPEKEEDLAHDVFVELVHMDSLLKFRGGDRIAFEKFLFNQIRKVISMMYDTRYKESKKFTKIAEMDRMVPGSKALITKSKEVYEQGGSWQDVSKKCTLISQSYQDVKREKLGIVKRIRKGKYFPCYLDAQSFVSNVTVEPGAQMDYEHLLSKIEPTAETPLEKKILYLITHGYDRKEIPEAAECTFLQMRGALANIRKRAKKVLMYDQV